MKPSPSIAGYAVRGLSIVALLGAWTAVADEVPDVALSPPDQPLSERAREGWWVSEQEEDPAGNFVLYQKDVEGSRYSRYRMEALVAEPLARVVQALRVKSEDEKYLAKGRSETVLKDLDGYSLLHLYIDTPFVADRDVILRSSSGYRSDGAFRVEWSAANDEGPPSADGVVRMPRSEGFWHFTPLSETHTLVVYEQFADLGGSVPGWLVDANMDDEILAELSTLRGILDEQRSAISAAGKGTPNAGVE